MAEAQNISGHQSVEPFDFFVFSSDQTNRDFLPPLLEGTDQVAQAVFASITSFGDNPSAPGKEVAPQYSIVDPLATSLHPYSPDHGSFEGTIFNLKVPDDIVALPDPKILSSDWIRQSR